MRSRYTFVTSAMIILGALFTISSSSANAAVPTIINFQGILLDSVGFTVADGPYSLIFRIWDAAAGGSLVWDETQSVTTENGLFSTSLGATDPILSSFFSGPDRWLEMELSGSGTPYVPRTKMGSVAYAYQVSTVGGATGGNITSKVSIGPGHTNTGQNAFVAGQNNTVTGDYSTVGGGTFNTASGLRAMVGGGLNNTSTADATVVGGGFGNDATGANTTVAGGANNLAGPAIEATVGGGTYNAASGEASTVGGGYGDSARGNWSMVGGGNHNVASGIVSGVAAGAFNVASGDYSFVGGCYADTVEGVYSVIAGGAQNKITVSGFLGAIGGGSGNRVTAPLAVVAGGSTNTASGTGATVPGGSNNLAAGDYSFAAGGQAKARGIGSIVIATSSSAVTTDTINTNNAEQMVFRADGGIYITNAAGNAPANGGTLINTVTGAYLTTGGTWTNSSDRNLKENFAPVDRSLLLSRIDALPISEWNYKVEEDVVRHIGPTAQDFRALFGVGRDDKSISTIDPAGIALAAIQELHRLSLSESAQKDRQIAELRDQVAELRRLVQALTGDAGVIGEAR